MSLPSFDALEKAYNKIDFTELDEWLNNCGRLLRFRKGTMLTPRDGEILVIIDGTMLVSEDTDNGLALGHTFKYMPIGLIEDDFNLRLCYHSQTDAKVIQLTKEEANTLFFSTPQRAALFGKIMTYMSVILINAYFERNNGSGYAIIREMLVRYKYKSKTDVMFNEGVAAFILKRTRLSRSYVFQILAELKSGGYITVQSGKLVSIDREIPEKY